jgi:hypothetical protein
MTAWKRRASVIYKDLRGFIKQVDEFGVLSPEPAANRPRQRRQARYFVALAVLS